MSESLRDKSRRNWVSDSDSDGNIQLGCLLRIADATEKMAAPYVALISERDRLSKMYKVRGETIGRLERSLAAHKGVITKLKKRLEASRS